MKKTKTALPQVVTRAKWQAARNQLFTKEKQATRARDALNAQRRRLPMVRIEKDYVFKGPGGRARLLDMLLPRGVATNASVHMVAAPRPIREEVSPKTS